MLVEKMICTQNTFTPSYLRFVCKQSAVQHDQSHDHFVSPAIDPGRVEIKKNTCWGFELIVLTLVPPLWSFSRSALSILRPKVSRKVGNIAITDAFCWIVGKTNLMEQTWTNFSPIIEMYFNALSVWITKDISKLSRILERSVVVQFDVLGLLGTTFHLRHQFRKMIWHTIIFEKSALWILAQPGCPEKTCREVCWIALSWLWLS